MDAVLTILACFLMIAAALFAWDGEHARAAYVIGLAVFNLQLTDRK
jgi:hypothetical protein